MGTLLMRYFVCLFSLILFLGACAHSPSSSNTAVENYYLVKPDESMNSIALALNVPYELLRHSNPWLIPERIKPNMKLLLPSDQSVRKYQTAQQRAQQQMVNLNGHIWPLRKISVSSPFGPRSGRMHKGIDLRASRGTPIHATDDGVVVFSGTKGSYGKLVVIDHGQGIHTAYAHNASNSVSKGQRVTQGEVIAKVGRTGKATGNHVHYEIRRNGKAVNPSRHLNAGL